MQKQKTKRVGSLSQTNKQVHRTVGRQKENTGTVGIFRSDLLKIEPGIKLGSFFDDYGFADDHLVSKHFVISQWHAILKKHPLYMPMDVKESDSYDNILNILKSQTDYILGGLKWELKLENKSHYKIPHVAIVYYKNHYDDPPGMHLALDWLINAKDQNIRIVAMELFKRLIHHFRIDNIADKQIWEMDSYSTTEELDEYLQNDMGFDKGSEEYEEHYKMYYSYKFGAIAEIEKQLNKSSVHVEVTTELSNLQVSNKKIYDWIVKGFELTNLKPFLWDEYHVIYHLDGQPDEPGININDCVYFPWSMKDFVYSSVSESIDETYNNFLSQSVTTYGYMSKKKNKDLNNLDTFNKLKDFIEEGQELYHKYGNRLIQKKDVGA